MRTESEINALLKRVMAGYYPDSGLTNDQMARLLVLARTLTWVLE